MPISNPDDVTKSLEKDAPLSSDFLATVSTGPGVYQMLGKSEVLYVGKAINLRKRLSQYAHFSGPPHSKTGVMLSHVRRAETILTTTEKEALILEASLIKKHRPRYNVILRDDKNYPLIMVSTSELWPRINITRKRLRDGNRYFGPYAATSAMRSTLKLLYTLFPLRRCKKFRERERACLNFQMGRCLAPCAGKVSHDQYMQSVAAVLQILEGKADDVAADLQKKMKEASKELQFEKAASFRDQLLGLQRTIEHQAVVADHHIDQDIYGFYRQNAAVGLALLFVRAGIITGVQTFFIPDPIGDDRGILTEAMLQFYSQQRIPPREILLPFEIEDKDLVQDHLVDLRGSAVTLHVPQRGKRMQLMQMAASNAEKLFSEQAQKEKSWNTLAANLQKKLHLKNVPQTIECLDISNLQGKQAVGSLVCFTDGEKDTKNFRHYRIRNLDTPDDYAMMEEVLQRRFESSDKRRKLPDMLLLDGGKGQLAKACDVLGQEDLLGSIDLVAIAKEKGEEGEKLFRPGRKNPILLPPNNPALLYLMRIRDESHRFGITFHRKLRNKETLRSRLDDLQGVGEKRRKKLIKHFGSVKRVMAADQNELETVSGIGPDLAHAIFTQLHGTENET